MIIERDHQLLFFRKGLDRLGNHIFQFFPCKVAGRVITAADTVMESFSGIGLIFLVPDIFVQAEQGSADRKSVVRERV